MSRTQFLRVLILLALATVGSHAAPIRGRRGSFGMGMLGGALAGAVVGHAVAKHTGTSKSAAAPAASPVAQVVENGVPDANGCYKQTVKEPVAGHGKLYTETVHLVCPRGVPAAHVHPAAVAPVHVVSVAHAPVAPAAHPPIGFVVPHNGTYNGTHGNQTHANGTAGHHPAAGHHVVVPAVHAAAPVVVSHAAAPVGGPHVILLSKTVKKQKSKSAASSINVSKGLLILVALYCFVRK